MGSSVSTNPDPLTKDAFASLLEHARRPLWCIAVAITQDRELAHDVVQEAAVVALGKLQDFDPSTNFCAWMGQIVRFVALNHRRSRLRSRTVAADPGVIAANSAAPLDHRLSGVTLSAPLSEALEQLDDVPRTCLILRTVMDMGYAQIAEILSIPEGTAMSHVHRSRQAMRAALTARGIDSAKEGRP